MKRAVLLFMMLGMVAVWIGSPMGRGWALVSETSDSATMGGVEIQRYDKGVWYVEGPEEASLFFVMKAVGYAVATDRLWQAETFRRTARGRMAEIFGPEELLTDIFVRVIGYSRQELKAAYASLPPRVRAAVAGYVAGFNRRIREVRADPSLLPYEFKVVGESLGHPFFPEPWSPQDVLAWLAFLLRSFDPEGLPLANDGQVQNAALLQSLESRFGEDGDKMFSDLRWLNDPQALTYIETPAAGISQAEGSEPHRGGLGGYPSSLPPLGEAAQEMRELWQKIHHCLEERGADVKMGSYAWVVSGSKTASGEPTLYSGPQMGFLTPSIVVEGSIQAGGLHVSGMTLAGLPGIVIGRTPHHAWSMQVGHAHTADYYLETPDRVRLHRIEVIKVAGLPDFYLPVWRSDHGPVVHPLIYFPLVHQGDPIISWKYAHWGMEFETLEAFLGLATAQDMEEFGQFIEKVGVSQHFCYADRDGNIAYWMSGWDPVRPEGVDPRFPLLGDGTQEWPEPLVLKPRSFEANPSKGYFAGWNNKSRPDYDNAPNNLFYGFGPFHRAHVLEEHLRDRSGMTFEEVRDLALFIATTDSFGYGGNPWPFVSETFRAAVEAHPTEDRLAALALLDDWNGHFVAGGPDNWVDGPLRDDAWVLMDAWIREVLRLTFGDELGEDQPNHHLFNVLLHALGEPGSGLVTSYDWFQNLADPDAPQDLESIVVEALDAALFGLGPQPWDVERGEIAYEHPFLGLLHTTPFASRSTYAHCVAYGAEGPSRIESMFPLGESGTILMDAQGEPVFDPNFLTMAPLFDAFEPRPFPLFPTHRPGSP